MLEHLFRWNALVRLHAQDLFEKVNKQLRIYPLLTAKCEALSQIFHQAFETLTHQLLLFMQNFAVISSSNAEKSIINYGPSLKGLNSALQTQPEREPGQNFNENASNGPHIKNEWNVSEVLQTDVGLLSESAR